MRFAASLLAFAALVGGCGGSHARDLFDYDRSKPLDYVDHGAAGSVHAVTFVSEGRRVEGYLVLPPGAAHRPGVVFMPGGGGDRGELLSQAKELAARGVVVLTLTPPSSLVTSSPTTGPALLAQARSITVDDVVAVRRAVDVLQSLPAVDPKRIGFLGWSLGAKTGTYVAAVEPRVRASVLLSAGAAPVSAFVANAPTSLRAQARRVLSSIDPIRYIGLARPGSVLLEDGSHDEVVPLPALLNIARAAPKGTTVRWYDATHRLNGAAYTAAFDWLLGRLS